MQENGSNSTSLIFSLCCSAGLGSRLHAKVKHLIQESVVFGKQKRFQKEERTRKRISTERPDWFALFLGTRFELLLLPDYNEAGISVGRQYQKRNVLRRRDFY